MPTSLNKSPVAPIEPPPPSAPPPPPIESIKFSTPVRRIVTAEDLEIFQQSPTHNLLLSFITDLNNSVLNLTNSHPVEVSPFVQKLLDILETARGYVDEFPPEEAAGSRFGNKGFWGFYDALWERSHEFHKELGLPNDEAIEEVKRYLCESFGNRTRIDYGSGHELNFVTWLLCFRQLSLITPADYPALVLRLFNAYLDLMRNLQTTYYLEPAGSHGVWGLDDYQFLPFLFGSSQLYSHPYLRPKSIHNDDILEEFSKEYIYLSCISFINSIKTTAGLRWHSPMLDDISAARNWVKINDGMKKMYEKEVLGKLPVMQHFLFGGIVPADERMGKDIEREGEVVDKDGMRHVHSTWGECCGIKVPAAIAARKEGEKETLRRVPRIPFD
ncbi:Serine/threonine-protein phosphatase 2A activator 2 [Rhizina undulata]